ncbi:MAG: fibronectin type III domain-containing protein, partial [Candidatus Micrarchaeia archaeon]
MNARNPIVFLALALLLTFGCIGGPQAPSDLKASISSSGIVLSWTPSQSANVAGYNVYRSEAGGTLGMKINAALITSAAYTDSSAQNGKTYYYTVRAVSSSGSDDGNNNQVSITANITPPSGLSISINNGAKYTKSSQVSLSLSATGADKCRFSNDDSTWSAWEAYSITKSWNLDAADGSKTVYYQCENPSGILSSTANAAITLKSGPMAIAIKSPATNDVLSRNFQIDFTVSGNAGDTNCVANADGINAPIGTINSGETKFPLILQDGQHVLYVTCTDQLGTARSQNVNFETEENPLSFTINDGSPVTDYRQVKLYINSPAGSQCQYSNDAATWSAWEACPKVKDWTITTGDGQKTIYVQGKNSNGNSLGQVSDSITLDTTPSPEVYFSINNGDTTTYSQTVKLSIHANYATECRYGNG